MQHSTNQGQTAWCKIVADTYNVSTIQKIPVCTMQTEIGPSHDIDWYH